MKKNANLCILILIIMVSVLFGACKSNQTTIVAPPTFNISTPSSTFEANLPTAEVIQATPAPGSPNIISIYVNNGGTRNIVKDEFVSYWGPEVTIKCFEAITSTEDNLQCNWFGDLWYEKWDDFPNNADTKIGYAITLLLKTGEEINYDIKNPANTNQYKEYLETYLYDDYHAVQGVRYSHLTPEDINEDTIATSIKFVCGKNIDQVSQMNLTAYLYSIENPDVKLIETTITVKNSNN